MSPSMLEAKNVVSVGEVGSLFHHELEHNASGTACPSARCKLSGALSFSTRSCKPRNWGVAT